RLLSGYLGLRLRDNEQAPFFRGGRRVAIGGTQQQDAFTDRELAGPSPTASPAPTATVTASLTPTPTPTPTPCVVGYMITQIGGSIVPGATDTGNHGDDVVTNIALPFSFTLYDTAYTAV